MNKFREIIPLRLLIITLIVGFSFVFVVTGHALNNNCGDVLDSSHLLIYKTKTSDNQDNDNYFLPSEYNDSSDNKYSENYYGVDLTAHTRFINSFYKLNLQKLQQHNSIDDCLTAYFVQWQRQ